mgnify:CR=1 FL=1
MKPKTKYCYLVYANPEPPIVYGVYLNKKSALKYAHRLVEWRKERAAERNYEFGFYHWLEEDKRKETDFDKREKLIFSACLKIKDGAKDFSDDGCYVKVIRRMLNK